MTELAQTLAIAFRQRQKPQMVKTKYDYLVARRGAVGGRVRARLAPGAQEGGRHRAGARRGIPGQAPGDRRGAVEVLRRALRAVQARPHQADGPAEEPEARVRRAEPVGADRRQQGRPGRPVPRPGAHPQLAHRVERVPQGASSIYRVTTQKEFKETLNHVLRRRGRRHRRHRRPALRAGGRRARAAAKARRGRRFGGGGQRAGEAGQQDHHRRLQPGRLRHPHRALSRARARPRSASARTARSAALHRGAGELPRTRIAARIKIMCDLDISEKRKPQDGKIKFKKFGPLDIELRVATIPTAGRRRGHRHAYPRRRRADSARQAGLHAAQPGEAEEARSASPTACSSSAGRPARARPPRCTRCSST